VVKEVRYDHSRKNSGNRKNLWGITDTPKDILVYTKQEIDYWKEVEEAFITRIMKEGKVLYECKRETDK